MRKNIIYNFKPIVAGNMASASLTGLQTDVSQFDSVTYEFAWTGGQVTNGNIGIQYSKDGQNWVDLDFTAIVTTDGASGDHRLIITEIGFQFTRPIYTRTNAGATGTLNVSIFASNKGA